MTITERLFFLLMLTLFALGTLFMIVVNKTKMYLNAENEMQLTTEMQLKSDEERCSHENMSQNYVY